MLKPAILYKEAIECGLREYFYSDDMMFYRGDRYNSLLNVAEEPDGGQYQYAVTDAGGNLIGYVAYSVDYYSQCASDFGAFSFDRGNPIMGLELYRLMERLVSTMHRVEFRAISGNPATRAYDHFLDRHRDIGMKHTFYDVFRDTKGEYHDVYIYEFVRC